MDSNHHLQNRNLVCYHYTMEQYIVALEGVEPSLTEPKPVVLPLYHRALSVEPRGVALELRSLCSAKNHVLRIFSPPHTPSLPKFPMLLPQMDSNHHLQIQNLTC